MGRIELAREAERIHSQYRFTKRRERGRPKNRSAAGRPSIIDVSVVLKLEEAFAVGCNITEAISYAGISRNAFYEWLTINPSFRERIEQLRQNLSLQARLSLMRGLKYDAHLALKVLERVNPEEFSLKSVVTHNVAFTGISLDKPKPTQVGEQPENALVEVERFDGVKR